LREIGTGGLVEVPVVTGGVESRLLVTGLVGEDVKSVAARKRTMEAIARAVR
jgi:hypothetical protein